MTRLDIQTSVTRILKSLFPGIPVKSNDIREGIDIDKHRPCFFVNIVPIESGARSVHYSAHVSKVQITYWPPVKGAYVQRLKMIDVLNEVFLINFFVGDRSLLVQNKTATQSLDALEYSFDVEYFTGHVGGGSAPVNPPGGTRPEDPGNITPEHDVTLIDPQPYELMEEFFIEQEEKRK